MWKDYSAGFIRKNRASSISIMVAAFISALFLSLLCSLSYNFWIYEVERIVLEEGNWQGRITGEIDVDDLDVIERFANVQNAVINKELSEGQMVVVDICFRNMRTIYQDMPTMIEILELDSSAVSYHKLMNIVSR